MSLLDWMGMSTASAAPANSRAKELASPDQFFDGAALELLKAALAGNEASVQDAIGRGANANAQGPKSTSKGTPQLTLLHYAISVRNTRAMALLIAAGADPLFEPRDEDGPALLRPVMRRDAEILDALLQRWPMSKVPQRWQSYIAFEAVVQGCKDCLAVMFKQGMPVGITNGQNYNLFMDALSVEDLDLAEWLLTQIGVPLTTMNSGGITPANMVQRGLTEKFRPGTPTHNRYLKFKAFMESKGIVFPVESSADWRVRNGVK